MRTGIANLPLHGGRAPRWLFNRMKNLAGAIATAICEEYGPNEILQRLSDPFWFQAFGCVLGFDWHSSGVTTTTCGALKEGLKQQGKDFGLYVAGGKGAASRKTPSEIETFCAGARTDPVPLVYASRMSAKVDSAALQDGYQIYHHCFIFTRDGSWCVVQQGMNEATRCARRYHWMGTDISDFVCEPHAAVCCDRRGETLNMVAVESADARASCAEAARQHPESVLREVQRLKTLKLPRHHEVLVSDINTAHLHKTLLSTYERVPPDFESLLAIPGVGPKTVRSLALISELVYGAPASQRDPVLFSFAHGGKDGFPFPVDRTTYDRSIRILRQAVERAKLGQRERLDAIKDLRSYLRSRFGAGGDELL